MLITIYLLIITMISDKSVDIIDYTLTAIDCQEQFCFGTGGGDRGTRGRRPHF